MILSIKARHSRKTGQVIITFAIDRKTWERMERSAPECGLSDPLDYVAGRINVALFEEGDVRLPPAPEGEPDDGLPF